MESKQPAEALAEPICCISLNLHTLWLNGIIIGDTAAAAAAAERQSNKPINLFNQSNLLVPFSILSVLHILVPLPQPPPLLRLLTIQHLTLPFPLTPAAAVAAEAV